MKKTWQNVLTSWPSPPLQKRRSVKRLAFFMSLWYSTFCLLVIASSCFPSWTPVFLSFAFTHSPYPSKCTQDVTCPAFFLSDKCLQKNWNSKSGAYWLRLFGAPTPLHPFPSLQHAPVWFIPNVQWLPFRAAKTGCVYAAFLKCSTVAIWGKWNWVHICCIPRVFSNCHLGQVKLGAYVLPSQSVQQLPFGAGESGCIYAAFLKCSTIAIWGRWNGAWILHA